MQIPFLVSFPPSLFPTRHCCVYLYTCLNSSVPSANSPMIHWRRLWFSHFRWNEVARWIMVAKKVFPDLIATITLLSQPCHAFDQFLLTHCFFLSSFLSLSWDDIMQNLTFTFSPSDCSCYNLIENNVHWIWPPAAIRWGPKIRSRSRRTWWSTFDLFSLHRPETMENFQNLKSK